MCSGLSTRASQGGSVAVLRPTGELRAAFRDEQDDAMLLLFSNGSQSLLGLGGTLVEIQGWGVGEKMVQDRCWIVIHRNGDLSASARLPVEPFLSFPLNRHRPQTTQLSETLHLDVGDKGIVGRKVSVMVSSGKGPRTLAEGIIGWN